MSAYPTHRPPRSSLSGADFWLLLEIARLPAKQLETMAEIRAADQALAAREKVTAARETALTMALEKQAASATEIETRQAAMDRAAAAHQEAAANHKKAVEAFDADRRKRIQEISDREKRCAASEAGLAASAAALKASEATFAKRVLDTETGLRVRHEALTASEAEFARRYASAKAILDAVPAAPASNGAARASG